MVSFQQGMDRKRVLVIGAGISGIGCIALLKERGLEPVCYEASDKYGGGWNYQESENGETKDGETFIPLSTTTISSKEMGAGSNFPPKKEYNNHMNVREMYEYIIDYAKHFDCQRQIHCNMEVTSVRKAPDYDQTGRWCATTKNHNTGEVVTETFDGVFVATGHVNRPIMPTFPGQAEFGGRIIHTHSLRNIEEFAGQTVVVVGVGCSALDAAVEISRVAKQVYLSTRGGAYIFNRTVWNGYPTDCMLLRRFLAWILGIAPIGITSWFIETLFADLSFNQTRYYSKPAKHILCKEIIMNDLIGSKLHSGEVVQKGNIEKFFRTGVVFEGEDQQTTVDSVVMGTGYTYDFPFLEDGIFLEEDGMIKLYKCMYPPHLPHPTLAMIGFFIPQGPAFPVGELQIRWAVHLLKGAGRLPSQAAMMEDIIKRHEMNLKRFGRAEKTSIRVDFVDYMDEIASEMGVKPNLLKYLITDFPLFLQLFFGPCLPYQYRLEGPEKWEGAREAIMTANERIQWPLRKEKSE